MSTVKIIDPITDPRWDKFVESHPFGLVCHLSGWKRILEQSFNHMKGYYFVLFDENDKIKAGLPIYEVKSWLTGKRLVSIPFATLCDPLISTSEEMTVLLKEVMEFSRDRNISYLEIRTLFSPSLVKKNGRLYKTSDYRHHYLPLDATPDLLMQSFHRTCVRKNIRKASKSSLKIKVAVDMSDVDNFYRLYSKTRKHLALPPHPYRFIQTIWNEFSVDKRVIVLLAEKEGQPIASMLLYKFRDRVSAEYLGWDRMFADVRPSSYIYWEAIKLAHSEGYKIFDFGRTSKLNKSLMDFKIRWGTKVIELPQFFYPEKVAEEMSEHEKTISYRIMRKICSSVPEAAFQAVGKMCYRHLG